MMAGLLVVLSLMPYGPVKETSLREIFTQLAAGAFIPFFASTIAIVLTRTGETISRIRQEFVRWSCSIGLAVVIAMIILIMFATQLIVTFANLGAIPKDAPPEPTTIVLHNGSWRFVINSTEGVGFEHPSVFASREYDVQDYRQVVILGSFTPSDVSQIPQKYRTEELLMPALVFIEPKTGFTHQVDTDIATITEIPTPKLKIIAYIHNPDVQNADSLTIDGNLELAIYLIP